MFRRTFLLLWPSSFIVNPVLPSKEYLSLFPNELAYFGRANDFRFGDERGAGGPSKVQEEVSPLEAGSVVAIGDALTQQGFRPR